MVESEITKTQNLLYRLTGDTTLVHVDPEICKEKYGMDVFMHGLCTYGFACRMAVQALIPDHPERVRRFAAQMRAIVFPGTKLQLGWWKTSENSAVFKMVNSENGQVLLDHGALEWV